MGCNCNNKCTEPILPYRVVQTRAEMRSIPCDERINGMIVTVIQENFKQYQVRGGDICNNNNWVDNTVDLTVIYNTMGHDVLETGDCEDLTNEVLNTYYPEAKPGFRATVEACQVTYMKINDSRWLAYSTFSNNLTPEDYEP